jgi:hypothetical protein
MTRVAIAQRPPILTSLALFAAVVALAPSPHVAVIEPEPLGPRPPVFAGQQLDYRFDPVPDMTDRRIVVRPPATGDRMPADLLANGFAGDPHIFLARPEVKFMDMMLSGIARLVGAVST